MERKDEFPRKYQNGAVIGLLKQGGTVQPASRATVGKGRQWEERHSFPSSDSLGPTLPTEELQKKEFLIPWELGTQEEKRNINVVLPGEKFKDTNLSDKEHSIFKDTKL